MAGTGVLVTVAVAGIGVLVAVAGTGVLVAVAVAGIGVLVAVAGTGVLVAVAVAGNGVLVLTGLKLAINVVLLPGMTIVCAFGNPSDQDEN